MQGWSWRPNWSHTAQTSRIWNASKINLFVPHLWSSFGGSREQSTEMKSQIPNYVSGVTELRASSWKDSCPRAKEDRAVQGLHLDREFGATSKISTFRQAAFLYITYWHHKLPSTYPRKTFPCEQASGHSEQFNSSTCQDPVWQCHHLGLYWKCLMHKCEYDIAKIFKQGSGSLQGLRPLCSSPP